MPTLTGTIRFYGQALQTALEFTTLDAPRKLAGWIESAGTRRISTDANGAFSIALPAGQYRVKWTAGTELNTDTFTLPDEDETYDLSALIAGAPPEDLEQWINNANLALAAIYPEFATIAAAQAATITATRIDVRKDANEKASTFVADATFAGPYDGAAGFQDAVGTVFKRFQRE